MYLHFRLLVKAQKRMSGKCKSVDNHCNELRLLLVEANPPHRQLELIFRAYNDGVAFRYFLPQQPGIGEFRLTSERSEFHFAGDYVAWAADYGGFVSHQESEFNKIRLNKISPSQIFEVPLLIKADQSVWVALTEANLTDWAGMYLTSVI